MARRGPTDKELTAIEELGIAGLEDLDTAYDSLSEPVPVRSILPVPNSGHRVPPKPNIDWYDEHQR